jgi:periplasmic divalent cation tolerance protein
MKCYVVFSTFPDEISAEETVRMLIEERLIACANLIDEVRSIYRWKGKIEDSKEILVKMKTSEESIHNLMRRLKQLHPYEVPEIVAVDLRTGNKDYLNWIVECTN